MEVGFPLAAERGGHRLVSLCCGLLLKALQNRGNDVPTERKRSRVSIEVSAEELRSIDNGRGSLSRAEYCKQRVMLSSGFGDPTFDACARILGAASATENYRWENLLAAGEMMREARELLVLAQSSRGEAEWRALTEELRTIRRVADSLFVEVGQQTELIAELVAQARKFAGALAEGAERGQLKLPAMQRWKK